MRLIACASIPRTGPENADRIPADRPRVFGQIFGKDEQMTDAHPARKLSEPPLSSEIPFDKFNRLKDFLPVVRMGPSRSPCPLPLADTAELPAQYRFDGHAKCTEQFLLETETAALLILQNGSIRYEQYWLTGGVRSRWIAWSIAKSFVSALVGIAIAEGHIGDIEDPISKYIRVEPGSAYDGVSIKNILQMSSGARWDEDFNDSSSDFFRLGAAMGRSSTLEDFVATMVPETAAGTTCRYSSGDTQALGILIARATGQPLSTYMWEKLCDPLEFETASYWLVDEVGTEMAFAGLTMTARDFAKFGELYRCQGARSGRQIVPAAWVDASVRADAAHLAPRRPIVGEHLSEMAYGYQWWIPPGGRGDFAAMEIHNQLIYVDPGRQLVIVKLSQEPAFCPSKDPSGSRELENIAVLRSIGDAWG